MEVYTVDIVGMDRGGGDMRIGVSFGEIGRWRDGIGRSRIASCGLMKNGTYPETYRVVHAS